MHNWSSAAVDKCSLGNQNSISDRVLSNCDSDASSSGSGVTAISLSQAMASSWRWPQPARSQRAVRRVSKCASWTLSKPSPPIHSSCSCRKLPGTEPRGKRCQGASPMCIGETTATAVPSSSKVSSSARCGTCAGAMAPICRVSEVKLPTDQSRSNSPTNTGAGRKAGRRSTRPSTVQASGCAKELT